MLELLASNLHQQYLVFNLLRYISFRVIISAFSAMFFSLILGHFLIPRFKAMNFREKINEDGPKRHQSKAGTPTMGGVIVLISVIVSTLLWANLSNMYVILALGATLWMGFIGFLDDYTKLTKPGRKGMLAKHKFLWQSLLGLLVGIALYIWSPLSSMRSGTEIPFIKTYCLISACSTLFLSLS
jgi:phospho-N-acetylmuramoyl-pentapeptide-transferase